MNCYVLRESKQELSYRFEGVELQEKWVRFKKEHGVLRTCKKLTRSMDRKSKRKQYQWLKKAVLDYVFVSELEDGHIVHFGLKKDGKDMGIRQEKSYDWEQELFWCPLGKFSMNEQPTNEMVIWYQEIFQLFLEDIQREFPEMKRDGEIEETSISKGSNIIPFPLKKRL